MVNKKLMETGILIKLDIAHFILRLQSVPKKTVMAINILHIICIGYFLEAPGPYQ